MVPKIAMAREKRGPIPLPMEEESLEHEGQLHLPKQPRGEQATLTTYTLSGAADTSTTYTLSETADYSTTYTISGSTEASSTYTLSESISISVFPSIVTATWTTKATPTPTIIAGNATVIAANSSDVLSDSAVAGIVVGVIAGVILILLCMLGGRRRRYRLVRRTTELIETRNIRRNL